MPLVRKVTWTRYMRSGRRIYFLPFSSRFLPLTFFLSNGPNGYTLFFNEDYTGNHLYGNGELDFHALSTWFSIPSNIQDEFNSLLSTGIDQASAI
jgi:hypothetical protein